ncbi:MAG TPA: hypothetical protein VFG50_01765 [Rhodothermales bacterium]|nr:hypothetical protein [Rhodothermales bacterium]
MSVEIVHKTAEVATSAAVDACWRQWRVLGFPASVTPDHEPTSIIDPEALVLLSAQVAPHERRLEDALAWWAGTGSTLLSAQRTSSLLRAFPPTTREAFGSFTRAAYDAGDRRWKRYVGDGSLAEGRRSKGPDAPALSPPPALMLRLRAGFGVGVKTDLLTYLLGRGSHAATIKDASVATWYTSPALRTAAAEMALAIFVRPIGDRPVHYVTDSAQWAVLFDDAAAATAAVKHTNGAVPVWHDWSHLFAFLAHVTAWGDHAGGSTPYVLSSRARDLVLPRLPVFAANRIDVPDPKNFKGEAYLEGLNATVKSVANWLTVHL